jgi:Ti-type conjugative transfer relaxase TraA
MALWSQFRMDASRHVSRGAGESAIAAAAYRSGEKLYDARTGEVQDYTRRYGVVASGIEMPETGGPDWTREELWNAAEAAERRKDARIARKVEVALPAEMTAEQRRELVSAWAGEIANRYKVAVDWAIHLPDKEGDQRNHHAHLLVSTREIGPAGFGEKAALELSNTDQKRRGLLVGDEAIYALRVTLAGRLNEFAARQGLDLQADPRSYADRGIDLEPTKHVGVHAVGMDRRGIGADRIADWEEVRRENRERIVARPEIVFETLTRTEAVFTRHDVARELNRHFDDAGEFQRVLARLDASPDLVRLTEEGPRLPARFSTREMIAAEERMIEAAGAMAAAPSHSIAKVHPGSSPGQALRDAATGSPTLSEEQQKAVEHVTAPGGLALIAGAAGTGKSAALGAAREVWEAAGYRVRGAALAGKAAEALQQASGIESRTLASLEYGWRDGRDPLGSRDVLVIDEAGMVGSRQLGRVLEVARDAGAKVVLAGDSRQLQPIEAGAAFRAIAEQVGVAQIDAVRRQREDWARAASAAFARGDIAAGLSAYAARGEVRVLESRGDAKAAIARDYAAAGKPASSLILAHTNEDVRDLNARVRDERRRIGELGEGAEFATARGKREFAAGDRVVFLLNDRDLGVKNGTLGTVAGAAPQVLTVQVDHGRQVRVDAATYAHVDHGYAVTVHKAQGTTVERAYVLASGGMDRHLAYVGMTRHRDAATLYAGRDDFRDETALAWRLGRDRPKASSLDFAERRGIDTPKPFLENARAWLEGGRERLRAVWERAEKVFAGVRERVSAGESEEARQGRVAALREELARRAREAANPNAENTRRQAVREMFGAGRQQSQDRGGAEAERAARRSAMFGPERAARRAGEEAERIARLRELAQDRTAKGEGREARLEALRRELAKEKPAKTAEQTRQEFQEQRKQAEQERAKPAAERRRDKGLEKDGGHEFER